MWLIEHIGNRGFHLHRVWIGYHKTGVGLLFRHPPGYQVRPVGPSIVCRAFIGSDQKIRILQLLNTSHHKFLIGTLLPEGDIYRWRKKIEIPADLLLFLNRTNYFKGRSNNFDKPQKG